MVIYITVITTTMVSIRPVELKDIEEAAAVCVEAFGSIHTRTHGRRLDFHDTDVAIAIFKFLTSNPKIKGVVAVDKNNKVVGSNFLDFRDEVASVGPISVSSSVQAKGIGHALMQAVLDIATQHNIGAVRLVQEAQNYVSLSLYIKMGFDVNETAIALEGHISKPYSGSIQVRAMTEKDTKDCDELHKRVVGTSRLTSMREDIQGPHPIFVALSEAGEIIGYANGILVTSYVVAKVGHEDAIYALHSAFSKANPNDTPLLKVIARLYPTLARRCLLEWGLQAQRCVTLMSYGNYVPISPSEGIYVPSIAY